MPPVYFCVTVFAMTSILVAATLISFRWQSKNQNQMMEVLQTVTNLAASKDLMTFQSLQTSTNQNQNPSEPEESLPVANDEAMANYLADSFRNRGIDPQLAFSNDDMDAIKDFGPLN